MQGKARGRGVPVEDRDTAPSAAIAGLVGQADNLPMAARRKLPTTVFKWESGRPGEDRIHAGGVRFRDAVSDYSAARGDLLFAAHVR